MDEPKQLLDWNGEPLLVHVLKAVAASGCDEVVVVLGYEADAVRGVLPPTVRVVVNPDFAEGQATSLRAGLDACSEESEAAVVLLGDQPQVDASSIDAILTHWRATATPIVRARYRDGIGHPVLLARSVWPDIDVTGDEGARSLIAARPELTDEVSFAEPTPIDVDTPEDYRALVERAEPR
jgi:molybdenum cofactor cytidylyltransferase